MMNMEKEEEEYGRDYYLKVLVLLLLAGAFIWFGPGNPDMNEATTRMEAELREQLNLLEPFSGVKVTYLLDNIRNGDISLYRGYTLTSNESSSADGSVASTNAQTQVDYEAIAQHYDRQLVMREWKLVKKKANAAVYTRGHFWTEILLEKSAGCDYKIFMEWHYLKRSE